MQKKLIGRSESLSSLPVGSHGRVVGISNECRGKKKFSDIGIVAGNELKVESKAPLGGLIRIKILGGSIALHKNDARYIMIDRKFV